MTGPDRFDGVVRALRLWPDGVVVVFFGGVSAVCLRKKLPD